MKESASELITWNLVTKNTALDEEFHRKLHQKVRKLDAHLIRFPHDALHLHVAIEKHPKKPLHTVSLTLRLPSHILHSEKSASEAIPAFDLAVKALLRELKTFKAHLRREHKWRTETFEETMPKPPRSLAEAPLEEGAGPQSMEDVVRDLFQDQYSRLVDYVARQLRNHVRKQHLVPGEIDPHAIVDEAARQALSQPRNKPEKLSYQLWFYTLIRHELQQRVQAAEGRHQHEVPLNEEEIEEETWIDQESLTEAGPPPIEANDNGDFVDTRDEQTASPDHWAAREDLIDMIRGRIHDWPEIERDVFELHFLEGFESHEIALIHDTAASRIETITENVQQRLRYLLQDELTTRIAKEKTPAPAGS